MQRFLRLALGATAVGALGACGSGADAPAGAFTTATFQTMPGRFDEAVAEQALRDAFPAADESTVTTSMEIARNACIVVSYHSSPEGLSAVFALRRTDHGADALEVALRAGCPNTGNYEPFIAEIENLDESD